MKEFITKNWKTIVIIAIVLILVWYFFLRKKKTESGFKSGGGPSSPPVGVPTCPSGQCKCKEATQGQWKCDSAGTACCISASGGRMVPSGSVPTRSK